MSIDSNISRLFSQAQSASSDAKMAMNRIARVSPAAVSVPGFSYTPRDISASKPKAFGDMLGNDTHPATIEYLNSEVENWLNKYFPELQACLKTAPEQWLCGIITGQKPFGMSKEVFEAVWHQSRDREYKARNSAVEQLRADYSLRGFKLPPGSMIASINQAEETASDAIGGVNVVQAIKDSEIKLDLLKFAEEQAIQLKTGVMSALAAFYNSWVSVMDEDHEADKIRVQAYSSLNNALADFYRTEVSFEQLRLRAAELRMNGQIAEADLKTKLSMTNDGANQAYAQAVRAFGDVSASAVSAAGTLQAEITTGS